ncbi:ABC transporter ATP-binding protein [Erysipelothrix sp. HDW6C]|uniref:ABC transporter ATP-binding protein n=1 Tax=Erysipelothrix sp. HDW6C TaxID=2714930 RepID=UPI00140B7A31|nr:ABC transporter ATP-binding protein [Erysipelothrix sp. HDW6C]QIK68798.1 ABC transporter ATP-binding protein [Erysipelothrix sp. HDW6C]
MEYALELKNISKTYQDGDQEFIALSEVSLAVKPGEFVAIVGPSGSGKSTLLSIAGALLSPSSGNVTIGDTKVGLQKKAWTKVRQDKVGFIFQSHQLVPYLNVSEQLQLIARIGKQKPSEAQAYGQSLLEDLGLGHRVHAYPSQLSGGEKQRVAIARAFMNHPEVILADEPTASLDGVRGRQVVERIAEEVKKRNKAAVMVTHDERILDLVDTVYRIESGKISKV